MSFSYMQPSAPKQNDKQQKASPYQQAPQQAGQTQQASPFSAPDMSVYSGPRTPPKGARVNDLSGQVPSNQIWAQAYNQGSKQYGGNTQAQSWTMPGTFTSQSYNPTTGQYSQPTGGQSWDGNMAYNAIDKRPGPIQANATGVGGNQMQWQDAMAQREAFVGNLSQRLNQYNAGQLTGPVTFDASQLLSQADDQLAKGTFQNPFNAQPTGLRAPGPENPKAGYETKPPSQWSDEDWAGYKNEQETGPLRYLVHKPSYYRDEQGRAQYSSGGHSAEAPVDADAAWQRERTESVSRIPANRSRPPDVQRAMDSATQYMTGTQWQNPFGNSPAANNPRPSWDQPSYDPRSSANPGAAQPIAPPSQGTPYNPQAALQSLPPVPAAPPSYGEDPIAAKKRAAKTQAQDDSDLQSMRDRWLNGATTGQSYKQRLGGKNFKDLTPDQMADEYTGELWKRLNDGRLSQADYDKAVAGMDTDLQQSKSKQSKLAQIDGEIKKWQAATYGTRTGGGPPGSYYQQIRTLQQLRAKAAAGDPAALAWSPKMKAPPANVTPTVPLNRRGSSARFGGLMQNGDNRR